jgi:hypothetical protein
MILLCGVVDDGMGFRRDVPPHCHAVATGSPNPDAGAGQAVHERKEGGA